LSANAHAWRGGRTNCNGERLTLKKERKMVFDVVDNNSGGDQCHTDDNSSGFGGWRQWVLEKSSVICYGFSSCNLRSWFGDREEGRRIYLTWIGEREKSLRGTSWDFFFYFFPYLGKIRWKWALHFTSGTPQIWFKQLKKFMEKSWVYILKKKRPLCFK